ncbi:hypothetical protein F4781DRAFT_397792 [Annulohypoxylon bovei var. microspora]|nr:hypothetical protein F4781DRAFT_397792 [Annulohypoxylon bovei var. microspora]
MFRVLISTGSEGEDSFATRAVEPPFKRSKVARQPNFACDHCKRKKVKCTSERGGCKRCLSKRVPCQYSKSSRVPNRTDEPTLPTSSSSSPVSETRSQPTALNLLRDTMRPPSAVGVNGTADTENPCADGRDSLWRPNEQLPSLNLANNLGDDLFTLLGPEILRSNAFDAPCELSSSLPNPEAFNEQTSEAGLHIIHTAHQDFSSASSATWHEHGTSGDLCSCVDLLLNIQEEIALRTEQQSDSSTRLQGQNDGHKELIRIYEVMKFYKAALGHSLTIIECRSCQDQSAVVMLLVIVCDQMANELVFLSQSISKRDRSSSWNKHDTLEENRYRSPDSDTIQGPFTKPKGSSSTSSGNWYELDGDDHGLIVRALTAQRLQMLDDLVQRSTCLVQRHCWKHHLTKLKGINHRIKSHTRD